MLFPQWPSVPSDEMIVVYPLLMYKSVNPTDQELIVCNLAQNEPQRVINLHPYRFVQFIDMGLGQERYFKNKQVSKSVNTRVYILVTRKIKTDDPNMPEESVLRIICYRYFPFIMNGKFKGFYREPSIDMISGEIDTLETGNQENTQMDTEDRNRLSKEKIRSATILLKEMVHSKQMLLVLQLVDGIYSISLNKEGEVWDSKHQFSTCKMLKFQMQRSPYEEVYYVEYD